MIDGADVTIVPLPLIEEQNMGAAGRVDGTQDVVYVRLHSDTGLTGYGEASSWPLFNGLTPSAIAGVIRECLVPLVIGTDEREYRQVPRLLGDHVRWSAIAKSAVEMAVLDLAARSAGLPLYALLGGRADFSVELSYSVSRQDLYEEARLVEAKLAKGYRIFKLKVGVLSGEQDARRLRQLRQFAPSARLRLDYNCLAAEEHLRALHGTACEAGAEFCEQPFPPGQVDRLRRLRTWWQIPISLDESIQDPDDVAAAAASCTCDIVSLKLAKAGGVVRLTEMADMAYRAGLGIYCGSFSESRLGVAAAMHAMSCASGLVAGSDFYFPLEIMDSSSLTGGFAVRDASAGFERGTRGLGVVVPAGWFAVGRSGSGPVV